MRTRKFDIICRVEKHFSSVKPLHMIFGKVLVKSCYQSYQWIELYCHLCCIPNDKDTVIEFCIKAAYEGCRHESTPVVHKFSNIGQYHQPDRDRITRGY